MDFFSTLPERLSRVHPFVWLLVAIGVAALVAVFAFGVSVGTAANYGFLALFFGGHMFMHGSHRGHQHGSTDTVTSEKSATSKSSTEHSEHSSGCH